VNETANILSLIIEECQKHDARMNYAHHRITAKFPLDAKKYSKLTDDEISLLDQFVFRFMKLQDAIGGKLFKATLNYLGEDSDGLSAIDIFNRMEKLGIIDNYEEWKFLRNLRNEFTHEYENNISKLVETLNILFAKKEALEKYLFSILEYLSNREDSPFAWK